jgi:hypothetical protein
MFSQILGKQEAIIYSKATSVSSVAPFFSNRRVIFLNDLA